MEEDAERKRAKKKKGFLFILYMSCVCTQHHDVCISYMCAHTHDMYDTYIL